MKLAIFILSLLLLLFSTTSAANCRVPLIVFLSLNYPFTLRVQNTAFPAIHNKAVRFIGVGTPGDYRAVLAPAGSTHELNLTESHLKFAEMRHTAHLQAPQRTVYRQVSFVINPADPLKVMARYACDENGMTETVLAPVDGSLGGFCVARNGVGEYGLYVKPRDQVGTRCIDVVLAVNH